jgi:hypothetical protein
VSVKEWNKAVAKLVRAYKMAMREYGIASSKRDAAAPGKGREGKEEG